MKNRLANIHITEMMLHSTLTPLKLGQLLNAVPNDVKILKIDQDPYTNDTIITLMSSKFKEVTNHFYIPKLKWSFDVQTSSFDIDFTSVIDNNIGNNRNTQRTSDIYSVYDEHNRLINKPEDKETHECTCNTTDLFHFGCRCGGK